MTAPADWIDRLHQLRARLDEALALATQHAAGAVDAQAWTQMCAALAEAFAAARPHGDTPVRDAVTAAVVADIGVRIQMLMDMNTRLQAANRLALTQLLPQDALQTYAQLGRQARGRMPYR